MKKEYDFSKGRRGAARELPPADDLAKRTKVRITIMLDRDVLDYFRGEAAKPGADAYQTQINLALRRYAFGERSPEERLSSDPAFIDRVAERVVRYIGERDSSSLEYGKDSFKWIQGNEYRTLRDTLLRRSKD